MAGKVKQQGITPKVVRRAAKAREFQLTGHRGVAEKVATQFGLVDFKHKIITNSMRGTYTTCRRKFFLDYGQRLRQRGVKHYFHVGGMVHKELEHMYTSGKFDKPAMMRRVNDATREVMKVATSDQQEKLAYGAAVAIGLVTGYASVYLRLDTQRMVFPELEKAFGPIPIPGTDWSYAGVRDGSVLWVADDDRYDASAHDRALLENKTTAAMDSNYFARLPVDNQIQGYLWSIQEEGGAMPSSVLYNVMQKSRLRQRQGESRSQFLDRVVDDYMANSGKYFYREKVVFGRGMLKTFVDNLVDFVRELDWCIANDNWTMNDRACTHMGICDYFPLCSTGFKDEDAFMLYERRETMHAEVDIDFDE